MSDEPPTPEMPLAAESFDADGPLELDVEITAGRVEIDLSGDDARVEIRTDPAARPAWADSAAGVLNWVGDVVGARFGTEPGAPGGDPTRQTRVEKVGDRLIVRGPKAPPPMGTPVAIAVRAPAGSHVQLRSGFAAVAVTGPTGRLDVRTGSGDVTVDRADDTVAVRTGGGAVDIAALTGPGTLTTGAGAVRIGEVHGPLLARTSSGAVSVSSASAGTLEIVSGSGEVRVGIAPGTGAEIDLSTGSGQVSSELDVASEPPARPPELRVHARSGSGDVRVTRAG